MAKPPRPRPAGATRQERGRRRCPNGSPRAGQPGRAASARWAYELKLDGYRLMSRIEDGRVRLLTRNGHDWTERLPHLEKALAGLGLQRSWLDGELVVLDEKGRPDFQACRTPSRKVAARTSCTSSSTCRTTKARICAMSPWRSAARAWRRCWKGATKTRCGSPRRSRKTPRPAGQRLQARSRRRDRQASGQRLPFAPQQRLDQAEVPVAPGVRDRRLYRAEGLSPAYRRLAARPLQPLTRSAGCAMPARSAAASPRPA